MSANADFSSQNQVFHFRNRTQDLGAKIWTMTFDLPGEKVNKFDARVMSDMEALLPKLKEMGERGEIDALVVLSGKPGIFIAGADIQLIRSAKTAEEAEKLAAKGQHLLNVWEDLPFPRIVAINGAALGGGCEFSLASSAILTRIAFSCKRVAHWNIVGDRRKRLNLLMASLLTVENKTLARRITCNS